MGGWGVSHPKFFGIFIFFIFTRPLNHNLSSGHVRQEDRPSLIQVTQISIHEDRHDDIEHKLDMT